METELKLLVNSKGALALRRHPLLKDYATSRMHEYKMSDTYFDTPDLQIRRGDACLRVRWVNSSWVQTLKGGGSINGGLHSRHEWELQVSGPAPDLEGLREMLGHKSAWDRLLRAPKIDERLCPIFTTHVIRKVWDLRLPHGDKVECVLDLGYIECNNLKVPISEIELELKSGNPLHLFDFALALLQDIPMQIGNFSKADRGYALYAPQPPVAVKATIIQLSKRMTIEKAFQDICRNCMIQIQANSAYVAKDDDAESLHQMRVGLRRLRTALGLFKSVLKPPEDLLQELDWLATQLSTARDWDVLAGSTLTKVAEAMADLTWLAELKLAALDKAHEKRKEAANAVISPRFTWIMLYFTRWSLACGWRDAKAAHARKRLKMRVSKFSRNMLEHQQSCLFKLGRKLQGANPKERHRVRIAAKNTRYAIEFFQSLFSSKKVRPFVDALSILQEELGWLNDAAVASILLKELQYRIIYLEENTSVIHEYLESYIKNNDKRIRKLWNKFVSKRLPC